MKQISENASPHLQPALHKTNKKLSRAQLVEIAKSNNNLPLFIWNFKYQNVKITSEKVKTVKT